MTYQINTTAEEMPPVLPSAGVSPITELFRTLRRHRLLFVGTTLAITALVAVATFSLTPRYTASATVVVRPDRGDPLSPNSLTLTDRIDDSSLETNAATLRSHDLGEEVMTELEATPETTTGRPICAWVRWLTPLCQQPTTPVPLDERVDAFLAHLQIVPTPRSRVMSVSFAAHDPKFAAAAVNALIVARQKQDVSQQTADLARTADWLQKRTDELRTRWLDAEQRAGQALAGGGGTVSSSGGGGEPLIARQIASAATDYSQAQAQLAGAEARASAVERAARSGDRLTLVKLTDEPLLVAAGNRLNELKSTQAQLQQTYGPHHPDVMAINGQIAQAEQKFAAESARAISAINEDLAVKRAQASALQQNLAALRSQNAALSSRVVDSRALDREAASARTIYETFLERTKQISDRTSILEPSLQFISKAEVPGLPSFPSVPRFLAAGVLLGVVGGAGAVFAREHFASGFANVGRLREQTGLPVLAAVPLIPIRRRWLVSLSRYATARPFSAAAESMRSLAAHTVLAGRDLGPRCIMVTSATSGEGKSTISRWLAAGLGRAGYSVLLIDGDHRKYTRGRAFKASKTPGLTDCLTGRISVEEALPAEKTGDVYRLEAGRPMIGPFGEHELERLRELVAAAKERYNLVVIDAPPVLAMAEGLVYASVADQTLFATRWMHTRRSAVLSALERLRAVEAKLTGIVLTMVDMRTVPLYNDEYRSSHARLLAN